MEEGLAKSVSAMCMAEKRDDGFIVLYRFCPTYPVQHVRVRQRHQAKTDEPAQEFVYVSVHVLFSLSFLIFHRVWYFLGPTNTNRGFTPFVMQPLHPLVYSLLQNHP